VLSQKKYKQQPGWLSAFGITPFLAAVFLCAQILATAHSAAYADADHLHDGVPCIVAAASKQCDTLDTANPAPSLERKTTHQHVAAAANVTTENHTTSAHSIRGPPVLS
jgi:hypothetical protein